MNVWIVSFDESEDASDPLLRAFVDRTQMERSVLMMAADTPFYDEVSNALADEEFSFSGWDPELEERLLLVVRSVRVEEMSEVLAKGAL